MAGFVIRRGEARKTCPACYSTNLGPARLVTDRYGFSWDLRTCRACKVEFQDHPLTDECRAEFYGSGEYRLLCEQATGKPWTNKDFLKKAQQDYAERWWAGPFEESQILDRFLTPGRWLDYGGSTGVVSSHWAKNAARRRNNAPTVIIADYGDGATVTPKQAFKLGKLEPYNAIIIAQTLDHLSVPLYTLEALRQLVAEPNCKLFVDVVKQEHTAYKLDHDTYYPTAASFVRCVETAGWTVEWLDGETNPTHWTIGASNR